MAETTKLSDMFVQDAKKFIKELQAISELLQRNPDTSSVIDDAFRAAHSIKSEASYLHFDDIAGKCNALENILEECKRNGCEVNTYQIINDAVESIETLIDALGKKPAAGKERHRPGGEEPGEEKETPLQFNEFERQLIREALERREKLFRLYCEIEPSETMIYPRLFLLINNLELKVNVIKTIPEIEETSVAGHEIQVFFSSALEEEEIYKIISIDQIARIQLTRLNYDSVSKVGLGGKKVRKQKFPESPVFRVDSSKFEELKNGIEEVELLSRKLEKPELQNPAELTVQLRKIGELAGNIGRVLQRLYLISVRSELSRLKQYAVELSEKLGKQLEVLISGDDFEIDSRLLDVLSDVLVHLVRNAVDHGIEDPGERGIFQKEARGLLMLSVVKYGDKAIIQILDDGKGIELGEIREQAARIGLSVGEGSSEDLLSILSHPGFTTRSIATDDSGRGYGLDIATGKLKEVPDSIMRVTSKPGKGTVFTVIVPSGYTNVCLLVTKHSNKQICFQKTYVKSCEAAASENFSADPEGKLLYRERPVFTEHGRITKAEPVPPEKYAVEVTYLDRTGYVLVDEVLFEKEIFDRQIVRDREIEPHLYELSLAGQTDYFVVSPSLILHD